MKLVLGLDPGSRVAGFGVVGCLHEEVRYIAHGSIRLPTQLSFAERLLRLGNELEAIFERYQPQITVVEKIFLGKNADSAFRLGHARGICLFHAAQSGTAIFEYATRSVKKGITGSGAADKQTVQVILSALLGVPLQTQDEGLDASDALALAVYHARSMAVESNINLARKRQMELG